MTDLNEPAAGAGLPREPTPLPAQPGPADSAAAAEHANRFSQLVGDDAGTPASSSAGGDTDEDAGDDEDTDQPAGRRRDAQDQGPRHGQHAGAHRGRGDERPGGRGTDGGRDRDAHERRHEPRGDALTAGEQILRGMLGGGAQPAAPAADGPHEPTWSVGSVSDLIDKLAQQVLVTDPRSGAEPEVRIQLKGSVLGGTEIRIAREHGELSVRLLAPAGTAAQQLQAHAGDLQAALAARVNATARVSVDVQGGGAQGGGSGSGGGQQHGDGRSRNRRQIPDEWDPDDGDRA
jgi:type III secretion system needle length determinant